MNEWLSIASIVVAGMGSAAVTVALLYSSRQAKTLRAQLELDHEQVEQSLIAQRAGNDLKLMGHTMALDRLFVDIPELRPYFYEGQEIADDEPMKSRVMATAELIVDLADSVASMMRLGQLDPADEEAWVKALRSYGRSPAVRLTIEEDLSGGAWRDSTVALLLEIGDGDEIGVGRRGSSAVV